MTVEYNEYSKSFSGRIIADTRPGRAEIYLDGEPVMNTSGQIARTPTVIQNVPEGIHSITFSKPGYTDITIITNVLKGSDCHARALLNTSMFSYPLMLSSLSSIEDIQSFLTDDFLTGDTQLRSLQPSPGWPYLPIRQVTYGHIVANTTPDGAEIYLDGQPVRDINGNIAITPSSIIGIITGIHLVTFKKSGYADTSVTVEIQNGLYSNIHTTLEKV